MLCAIYRSLRHELMYLYVRRRDDFSGVPQALLARFGQPRFVMLAMLDGRKPLANADWLKVRQALEHQGYYLQMPPAVENLLTAHLAASQLNDGDNDYVSAS